MNLITKAEYARRREITRARVTQLAKSKEITVINDAGKGKIDVDGPETKAYEGRSVLAIEHSQHGNSETKITQTPTSQNIPQSENPYEGMALKEAQQQAKTRKMIADAATSEIKLKELTGELITRDLVVTHILGPMDGAFRRMLDDAPITIAARLSEAVKAGESLEELEKIVRDQLSQLVKGIKSGMRKAVNGNGNGKAVD